jgi:hypothetical protein
MKEALTKHPRVHVALAIMRTGPVPLVEDEDEGSAAQKQSEGLRRPGIHKRVPSALSVASGSQKSQNDDSSRHCKKRKCDGGSQFEEHYTFVLRQVQRNASSTFDITDSLGSSYGLHRNLTFASLITLKHAVMVYRSRSQQTLYVSTPFLPGATTPTLVATVGRTKDARNNLINEAKIYGLLREKGIDGVPVLIGLFDDNQVPILITTYAGDKIHNADDSLK